MIRYCVLRDQDKVEIHNKTKKGLSQWPFLYEKCIICLDELGQTFAVCLVMRLKYKDRHKVQ